MARLSLVFAAMLSALPFVESRPAEAQAQISIPLYAGEASDIKTVKYACSAGGDFVAQFVNTPRNSLALVTMGQEFRVFVAVISGSGTRYVAGALELRTKGDNATMENVMEEGSMQDCVAEASEAP